MIPKYWFEDPFDPDIVDFEMLMGGLVDDIELE